ncbi:hypothetical protein [Pyrococcus yayanosii]|uniref:Uncharacterized protein n=1 Tax=Pyrococcus yayanosii (strain CH1 / JCM 16557) TaxID=529709 RepID=F8AEP6_PYRYC|nr:hypothetical protein [Pyrococcus yayanosii]AEH24728.1 hypothetical protein PYCH_10470 [Pyrococcus yayanosii CH1]
MDEKELLEYLSLLRARMEFAEKFYGFRMNYLPLYLGNDEIIVLDRRDGRIKRLSDKRPIEGEELRRLLPKIIENIRSGFVDTLLTMNFSYIHGPED